MTPKPTKRSGSAQEAYPNAAVLALVHVSYTQDAAPPALQDDEDIFTPVIRVSE